MVCVPASTDYDERRSVSPEFAHTQLFALPTIQASKFSGRWQTVQYPVVPVACGCCTVSIGSRSRIQMLVSCGMDGSTDSSRVNSALMKALMIGSGRPYSDSIVARLIDRSCSMASRKAGSVRMDLT